MEQSLIPGPFFNSTRETELDSQTSALEPESDCEFDDIPVNNGISNPEFPETDAHAKSPTVGQRLLDADRHPEFIPIKVPLLCNTMPYDNLGFWNFPTRMGWKVNREDRWCHSDCPPGTCKAQGYKEAFEAPYGLACPAVTKEGLKAPSTPTPTIEKIAFLQAWLFFGALDEICALCGLSLNVTKTFIVEGMVTTEPLNGLPGRLYNTSSSQRLHLEPASLMIELLRVARHVQLIITRRTLDDEHEYTFEECLVLSSISIVLRTIVITALHYIPSWTNCWEETKPISCLANILWLPEGQSTMQLLLEKQPLPRGWCSVSELDGLGHDSKFFAYYLERPHAPRDHSKCTETKCLANQTDTATYRTAHVSDECNCSFIAIDPEQLKDSLERNQIPKITISSDSDDASDTIALTVVDGENRPYIAISHVWADGLGNPRENSLPHCQLLRLRNLIDRLMNIVRQDHGEAQLRLAFWIDTLCIPVAPHLKDYRRLAIHQIRETFRDATATLVLDRELYNLDTRVISNMEIGIRIFCGGWAKRLWTLKEAVYTLATSDNEKLFFQMKEDLVEWSRSHTKFKYHQIDLSHKNNPTFVCDSESGDSDSSDFYTVDNLKSEVLFESFILWAMDERLPSLQSLMETNDMNPQFFRLADAVRKRSTSKQEDEPLCLTFLLGRLAENLLKSQNVEERMTMFYLELGKVPKVVLFEAVSDDVAGSKPEPSLLQKPPFRWAPASLASFPPGRLKTIRLMHEELREVDTDFEGLGTCEPDGLHIHNSGFLLTGKGDRLSQPLSYLKDTDTGEIYELVYWKEPPYREIGILFWEVPGFASTAAILQIEKIRVSRKDQDQDAYEYYGTIVGHGKFSRSNTAEESFLEGHQILNGRMLNTSQRWCIT